ncbi:hypothetical protein HAX54_016054 [Datura stramonium]|uniref:Uncharacterized protein n=1 Tax=Datura stramonium TaxID=4076 RepID=A0ABS8UJT8_DATST|nr:hypothetical protein [Datura stramonium]
MASVDPSKNFFPRPWNTQHLAFSPILLWISGVAATFASHEYYNHLHILAEAVKVPTLEAKSPYLEWDPSLGRTPFPRPEPPITPDLMWPDRDIPLLLKRSSLLPKGPAVSLAMTRTDEAKGESGEELFTQPLFSPAALRSKLSLASILHSFGVLRD